MSLNKSKSLRTAEKYVLQGKISAAIDEYRKVVEADPADLTTINTLGDLYVRAGRIPDAISNFSRIADSYRDSGFTLKAIAMLKKISKLDPTNIDTAMKLANLYSQQGLLVEARQQYLQVADAYARSGQARKALEAYQKIADLDPTNTAVRMKLGEIYSREGMIDQAHESFIMAGAEFLRKTDMDQALGANLKALAIYPESRQALTAIVNIYTQQGQADRAINILCDAFEKNPGDVELLTILGRTYLSAGWMDEAERTFLSLVELDRNRYHYLLEVGRKFLQLGDLDRAAEQIDGCLDVLISKREEDKAIDFLRRVLDKDNYHVGALKRTAQIFMRIREDHNLIAALNSLAEAAMRKGDDSEAVAALKELARLEPDEPRHRQRLYNLGVRDITDPTAPDVIRATGPLDYQSAAFDDAFVIRQISEAEILAGHGQVDHAVSMLKELLNHATDNIQVHLKLKDIYLRAGILEQAASECLDLARIYEVRGESSRAGDYLAEAQQLNPLLEPGSDGGPWERESPDAGLGMAYGEAAESPRQPFHTPRGGFDLSQYQTGMLGEQLGFVTVPDQAAAQPEAARAGDRKPSQPLESGAGDAGVAAAAATGDIPRVLKDELEGVDFYIAQGYIEIARDTLDRLREEHGDHPEVLARYKRLGIMAQPTKVMSIEPGMAGDSPANGSFPLGGLGPITGNGYADSELHDSASYWDGVPDMTPNAAPGATTGELMPQLTEERESGFGDGLIVSVGSEPIEPEPEETPPFLVHKETGPFGDDLMVKFNTSELSKSAARASLEDDSHGFGEGLTEEATLSTQEFDDVLRAQMLAIEPPPAPVDDYESVAGLIPERPSETTTPPARNYSAPQSSGPKPPAATADLIASLVSSLDDSFAALNLGFSPDEETSGHAVEPPPAESVPTEGTAQAGESAFAEFAHTEAYPEAHTEWAPPAVQAQSEPEEASGFESHGGFGELPFGSEETEVRHTEAGQLPPVEEPGYAESIFASTDGEPSPPEPELNLADEPALGEASLFAGELLQEEETASGSQPIDAELREMLEDLRGNTTELKPVIDFETHYSLGLAYKDMDLIDEAIEQFQFAFRMSVDGPESNYSQCCHMLGFCFKKKQMPKLAIMWFERGLKLPNRPEDEYQALRFEIGLCYEEMGQLDSALEVFAEVYGVDVNYRHVGAKLKQLQAAKNA